MYEVPQHGGGLVALLTPDPADRVRHRWDCPPSRRVVVETVARDATGQGVHVLRCQGCGAETEAP